MRSRTNKLHNLVATYWQPTVFYGMLILFFGLVLWFQLGTLLGGYSPEEAAALQSSTSLKHILDNPINAPFAIVAYLFSLLHFGEQQMFPLRAAATVFGLITLTTFYWLVRYWHGERSAILGTIIFGCSAWFLHAARLGTPEILLFLLLTLGAGSVWLKKTDSKVVLLLGFAIAAALFYIPGMLWLLLIGAAWQWKTILRLFKEHFAIMNVGSAMLLALLMPLILAIYKTPELAKVIAGLPAEGWPQLLGSLERLAHIPYNLVVKGPQDPTQWLATLPILDAFSTAMLVLGVYLYIRHWRLARSKMVAAALVVGAILIALGGAVNITLVMPFVYILIAAGIGFFLDRWQTVFPRNIIAQSVGVGLVSLAVIAASWYGLRHYFVAWPSAPPTKQVFIIK